MTTVNVVLTPNVDTDQTASAQAQISAAPNGTLANPTIINMPAGRYRINGTLKMSNRSHIRWTCLAGEQTYPNPPSDSQAFIAYTDIYGARGLLGRSTRPHFQIIECTNVVGSFLRIEGPHVMRQADNPLYSQYRVPYEGEYGFLFARTTDCGLEDCSYLNVAGDGFAVLGQQKGALKTTYNTHLYRFTGQYAGRMGLGIITCDGLEVVDSITDWSGFGGLDIEPMIHQIVWNASFTRVKVGCWFYPYTLGGEQLAPDFGGGPARDNILFKDCEVIRSGNDLHAMWVGSLGGDLTIDGHRFPNNTKNVALWWPSGGNNNRYENVTIKNCVIREQSPTTSYAIQVKCTGTLTIINNNFSGPGTTGFDNLATLSGVAPTTYIHYGNVWGDGTLNDGVTPGPAKVLSATSGHATLTGGVATLSVAAPPPPQPVSPSSFFGGAPIRLRSPRGWSRLRGKASTRIRGSEGPAERHPMRLRSPSGAGRLRSAQHPSYLRSEEPTAVPPTFFSITSGHVTLNGVTAALSMRIPATAGQVALSGGTAGSTVVGTIRPLFATSGEFAITGGFSSMPLTVTAGELALAGSATSSLDIPATPGELALGGGTAMLKVGLAAESGQVAIAGSIAGLNGEVSLSASAGQIALAGGSATVSVGTPATTSGHVAIQGGTATLGLGQIIHASPGELAIMGGRTGLRVLHAVGTGTITIQGGTAELSATEHVDLVVAPGNIHINGGTAHLNTYNQYPEWPMGDLADEWEMADA